MGGKRHGNQFFRGCYSRDAWTTQATSQDAKWRENVIKNHFICFAIQKGFN